jgi:arginyl-tRNA--protein-N-Asp/Glu arginylyltransferase
MHNQLHEAAGPPEKVMSDVSDWLNAQSFADLARYAKSSPQELEQVIVTDAMTEAAMDYVYSLYDPLMSTNLLEEIFRIMAVLQPKVLPGDILQSFPQE